MQPLTFNPGNTITVKITVLNTKKPARRMPSRFFLRAVSLTLAPEPMVSVLEKSLCHVSLLATRHAQARADYSIITRKERHCL